MLEPIRDVLTDFVRTVRVADLFDVALVAAFLFIIITWLQQITTRQTSRSLLSIAATFTVIYVLARSFEMYLVETLIEVLIVVLLLVTIVAFPSDMRRLIHRLGTWRFFRNTADSSASATVDVLTEAAATMAASKTGALIAIRGREPWRHLMQGGIEMDGIVSPPLLQSLFNPAAPGHDGAVLLEGDRVVTFATHLPLAADLPEASRSGGTRHAAALGLVEQCDAFVIVVSEERGTISVAHHGTLTPLASVSDLKERLAAFWQQYYNGSSDDRPAWWRRRMPRTALLSVVLATMLWLLFAYRPDTVYRVFTVPIELRNLEETRWQLLEPTPPSEARVTLTGSDLAFESLDPSSLVISLDVSQIDEGFNEFVIGEDDLPLPDDLYLYRVAPPTIQLRAQRVRPIEVRVEVRTTGAVPDSLELIDLRPEPDTVALLIPVDAAASPAAVPTQPIELKDVGPSATVETNLALPDDVRLAPDEESAVSVHVRVRPVP